MRRTALLVPLIAASCAGNAAAPVEGRVLLTVEPAAAAAGDTVSVRLTNGSDVTIVYYFWCSVMLERRTGERWVGVEQGRLCLPVPYSLQPGEEETYHRALPEALTPGEYRFSLTVRPNASRSRSVIIVSAPFTVP